MSREDSAEDIPYLSPATAPRKDDFTTADDEDYSTLKQIKKTLDQSIENLYRDFNAFDVLKSIDSSTTMDEAGKKTIIQILGKQEAYDILISLQQTIDTAIKSVEDGRKV